VSDSCTILIPTWNRGELLVRAVESALEQKQKGLRIIVIDNNSDPEFLPFLKMVKKLNRTISVFHQKTNIGPTGNWLSGLRRIETPWVKFLFSDDRLERDCISRMFELQNAYNTDLVISGAFVHFGSSTSQLYNRTFIPSATFSDLKNLIGNFLLPVSPSAALIRTDNALKALEQFQLPKKLIASGIGPDLVLMYEAIAAGGVATFTPEPLVSMYGDDTSISMKNTKLLGGYYSQAFRLLTKKYDVSLDLNLNIRLTARIIRSSVDRR
jgi:glycosyltransferase involved in cell wall biosynthesis